MKQYFPVISICLIILADAFLKSYIRDSVPWSHYYGIISTSALIILFLSSAYLLRYLASSKVGSNLFLRPGPAEEGISSSPSKNFAIVLMLILTAAIFRLWKLENLFDGWFWDEAYKGLDAIAIRDFGERPIFLNWNAGREALVAYLVAFVTKISGYSIFPIRAVEAFAGIVTL